MGIFNNKADQTYHAPGKGDGGHLQSCSTQELEKFATDPLCIEKEKCAEYLAQRMARKSKMEADWAEKTAKDASDRAERGAKKRNELEDNPFDSRTEVSADAQYIAKRIVKTLWIIFILIPIVLGILYALLTPSH